MFFTDSSELFALENIPPDENSPINEVILHPSIFVALRTKQMTTINYLIPRIQNLLEIAFQNVSSAESTASFQILFMMIPQLAEALIDHCIFYKFANNLLTNQLSDALVGKLSCLTLKLIQSSLKGALDSCSFIFQLLKYSENTSATYLFVNLMANLPELEPVQRWLINRNLVGSIIQAFNQIQIENPIQSNFFSSENEKLSSLFRIIETALTNPTTSSSFINNQILSILATKQEFICYVEDQRWKAILAFASRKSKTDNLKGLIDFASDFIIKDFTQIHQYHCFIIDLLTETMDETINPKLFDHLFNLMKKFPSCSLLHLSILKFFEKALEKKYINEIDIQFVGNQVFHEVQYTQFGTVLHASSMKLFSIFVKNGKKNKKAKKALEKINGFYGYAKNEHKSYKKVISAKYGNRSSKRFSSFRSSQ